nr:hypothetical protein [Abalone asfa-like virus]
MASCAMVPECDSQIVSLNDTRYNQLRAERPRVEEVIDEDEISLSPLMPFEFHGLTSEKDRKLILGLTFTMRDMQEYLDAQKVAEFNAITWKNVRINGVLICPDSQPMIVFQRAPHQIEVYSSIRIPVLTEGKTLFSIKGDLDITVFDFMKAYDPAYCMHVSGFKTFYDIEPFQLPPLHF